MSLPGFLIDAYGVFDPVHLRLEWRDETRPPHPELDRLVQETWKWQLEQSRLAGGHLFNGQLARYLRHEQRNGSLHIEVGPTDYAQFIGTNYLNPHRGDEFGWDLYGNPMGTSATVITSDGWLLYGRRDGKVACHPGYVHNVGGSLEAADRREDGTVDAFGSMLRELREEAGLGPSDLVEMVCLGMIRDPYVRQPELIFDAAVNLTRDEVTRRVHASEEEHTGVVCCHDNADAIERFIRETEKIAPVAVGALCLHGRRLLGEAWFENIMGRLPPPLPPH